MIHKPKPGDQYRWIGGNGSYLKDKKVYTVKRVSDTGTVWFEKCDSSTCRSRDAGLYCNCRDWNIGNDFELATTSPIIEYPTFDEIKKAVNLPSPDDVASFFKVRRE